MEYITAIIEKESSDIILSTVGKQTPLKIGNALADVGVPIIRTAPKNINLAEDHEKFSLTLDKLNFNYP